MNAFALPRRPRGFATALSVGGAIGLVVAISIVIYLIVALLAQLRLDGLSTL